MKLWTLDDIPWQQFDRPRVDADLVRLVKAASMVDIVGFVPTAYLSTMPISPCRFELIQVNSRAGRP